jgi:formamidopyrimidine-DNA glycosylase
MPELPEVETVRRGLHKLVIGKVVKTVTFDWPKSFPNASADVTQFLVGAKITDVRRRAKVLMIDLDTSYSLIIHLKMTGQLVFVGNKAASRQHADGAQGGDEQRTEPYLNTVKGAAQSTTQRSAANINSAGSSAVRQVDEVLSERFGAGHPNESLIGELPDKSTRVIFTFSDKSHLYFNDQRKFGWVRLLPTVEIPNIDFMKKVGPEPLSDEFTAKVFISRIRRRANTTIKAAILDQTVLAGIGNIYADEGLWGAKIHPATRVRDVSDARLKALHKELRFVLELSIEKGGSTDKNYVNAEGKRGSYIDFARVFRREGYGCPRHPNITIIKLRVAGRGTHICPTCQKLKVA